jgi:microcystin-dependent protein
MAKTRRQYSGGAVSTTVTSSLAASGVSTFVIASSTGWPSAAGVPFYIVVSPQTSSEEKMSVTISGTTLTIVSRGVDGTSASSHANGATVYPVITAIDMDEANELTSKYASRGSIIYQGSTTFEELAKGSSGLVLKAGTNDPEWGQVNTAGIADDAITAAKILAGAVGSSEIATNAVGSDEIAADAVITAKILDNNVTLAKLATAVQNALVPVGTIAMYGGASAPTGWLLCNGDAINGSYTSLISIVGANTPDLKGRFALGDNSTLTLLATGGSTTIATTNLPAHSHANTATASTTVTITDPEHNHSGSTGSTDLSHSHGLPDARQTSSTSHTHTGTNTYAAGGSATGIDNLTTDNALGGHTHTIGSAATGITASASTTVTMTNTETGGAQAYYQPYLVVNYIIKHD